MKPAARRRVEREIRELVRLDGDHCSLCRAPLEHNSRTYGGTTKVGKSVLAGDCCKGEVAVMVLSGIYLHRDVDDLVAALPVGSAKASASAEQVKGAIDALHGLFSQRQAEGKDILRRAGFEEGNAKLFTQQTLWKLDDASWFELRPTRAHRLRQMIGDEAVVSGFATLSPLPEGHELQVLVRQIEAGRRMRLPFARNLDILIPDDESVLHALFDIVSGPGQEGTVISTAMLRTAVQKFDASGQRPSRQ